MFTIFFREIIIFSLSHPNYQITDFRASLKSNDWETRKRITQLKDIRQIQMYAKKGEPEKKNNMKEYTVYGVM